MHKVVGKVEESDSKNLQLFLIKENLFIDVRKIKNIRKKFNEISDLIIKPDVNSRSKKIHQNQ